MMIVLQGNSLTLNGKFMSSVQKEYLIQIDQTLRHSSVISQDTKKLSTPLDSDAFTMLLIIRREWDMEDFGNVEPLVPKLK